MALPALFRSLIAVTGASDWNGAGKTEQPRLPRVLGSCRLVSPALFRGRSCCFELRGVHCDGGPGAYVDLVAILQGDWGVRFDWVQVVVDCCSVG